MKNLAFDFLVNKETKTITIKREFDAERSLVWDAYTKVEILEQWWAPKPWKVKTKSMNFKEGGSWHYAMVGPNGEEHWSLMMYKSIQPQKKFSGLDGFADAEANLNKDMPQSEWNVTFTDNGAGTLIEIQSVYGDLAQLEQTLEMGFKEGMTIALEGLDEVLASLKKK
jgi:uncharacterized protein YndB with AHSA1/START domain